VVYAVQLATAMESGNAYRSTAKLAHGMIEATRTRAVIEQAKGILISDAHVTANDAFALLTAMSQESAGNVRDMASHLVEERSGISQWFD